MLPEVYAILSATALGVANILAYQQNQKDLETLEAHLKESQEKQEGGTAQQTAHNVSGASGASFDPDEQDPRKDMEGSKRKAPEKIKNGPDFPTLKIHATKHSTIHPNAYYNNAVRHTQTAQRFLIRHDGQNKYMYVSRAGFDARGKAVFNLTSTSQNGRTIFTHIEKVTEKYLNRKGMTLPKGF